MFTNNQTPKQSKATVPPARTSRIPQPPAPTPSAHWPLLICCGQILEMEYEWLYYHRNETDAARATLTTSPPGSLHHHHYYHHPFLPSLNVIAWYRWEGPQDKDNACFWCLNVSAQSPAGAEGDMRQFILWPLEGLIEFRWKNGSWWRRAGKHLFQTHSQPVRSRLEAGEVWGLGWWGKGGEGDPRRHSAAVSALCACSVLPRCKKFAHLIYANVIAFTSHRLPLLLPLSPISRVQVVFLVCFF